MAEPRVRYPVERCTRCKQPTMSGLRADGLCRMCTELETKKKRADLFRRMLELLRRRRDDINWTGYEDVRRAVYGEPEKLVSLCGTAETRDVARPVDAETTQADGTDRETGAG